MQIRSRTPTDFSNEYFDDCAVEAGAQWLREWWQVAFLLQWDMAFLEVQDLELVASCPSVPTGQREITATLLAASNLLRQEMKTLVSTSHEIA